MATSLPLRWHGGKNYLAKKIVAMMPAHKTYVEPFLGGGSVLLAKDFEGINEVVNDLNGDLTNFWKVLQDDDKFKTFSRIVSAVPFSESEWKTAHESLSSLDEPIMRAIAFFVDCRQSMSGRRMNFNPVTKNRVRRGMNEQCSGWLGAIDGLPEVHSRLKRVMILNRDALKVIKDMDSKDTLYYLDPPYVHSTRSTTSEYGRQEMSDDKHKELLDILVKLDGMVMLSGYPSEMYDSKLSGWNKVDFDLPNNSASGESKERKTERIWYNFNTEERHV